MIPDVYCHSIFDIDYNKLKKLGYLNIFLDVDNTLVPYKKDKVSKDVIELIDKLKKQGFNVFLFSNSKSNRVLSFAKELDIEAYCLSMKPLKKNYKKVIKRFGKDNCIFIGDQFMTDVLGAKRNDLKIILVDRLLDNEPIFTRFWRFFERILLKRLKKKQMFDVYKYYDKLN